MFEKNIYQIWIQGCDKIEKEKYILNKKHWKLLNPDWNYHCLSDTDLEQACKMYSEKCHELYRKGTLHTKSDLGRLVLVYLYGGIYVDMDMYILRTLDSHKPLNDLIARYNSGESKNILGLSLNNVSKFESLLYVGKTKLLGNVITLSNSKNPILKEYIEHILDNLSNVDPNQMMYVNHTTGPMIFNKFMNNNVINNNKFNIDYLVFSHDIFEPCSIGNVCEITDNTIAIHNFELSWLSKWQKDALYYYFRYKTYIYIIIIVLICFILQKVFKK